MDIKIINKSLILVLVIFAGIQLNAQDIGETAPDFTLTSSEGESFTLSEQKGKVVFINFIGYTCGICIGNAATINTEIYDKFKSNDNFVAVAIDAWDGDEAGIEYYIENSGVSFPVLAMGSEVATAYNSGKHRIVVIDAEGIVQHNTNKDANEEEIADAVNVLNGLFNGATDTEAKENNTLKVYPNPTGGLLHFYISQLDETTELNIFNVVGKEVLSVHNFSSGTVDLSALPKGVYFAQLSNNGKLATQKIILE